MAMGVLMQQIAVIFLEILLGVVGFKTGVITDKDSKFMSGLVMKLLIPCTMLAGTNIEGGRTVVVRMAQAFLLTFALYVGSTGLCLLVNRLRKGTAGQKAVLVGTAAMPNCGFIGMPLANSVVGAEMGTLYATAGMASYNVWLFTYVEYLFRPGQKMKLKSLITPANVATLATVILLITGLRLPTTLQTVCSAVGGCTTPLALIIVGVTLAQTNVKELVVQPLLYLITVLRGIVFPLLFMLVMAALPLDRTMCLALAAIASCPSGSLAVVIAKQTGTEEKLAGQAVAQSTLFMLVTVPVMLTVAGYLFG
jgi:predicted permease